MSQNKNNPFIYLTVPYRYNCVYQKLLRKLSDLGIDILNDCGATCRGINRNIINCWNMFQAACGAYALGEEKKADLLINYINVQLKFGCPLFYDENKHSAIKTFDIPAVRNKGAGVVNITDIKLTFENPELLKENSLRIGASYTGTKIDTILADNLPIINNPTLNGVTFELKNGRNYFIAEATVNESDTVITSSFYVNIVSVSKYYYGVGKPSGSVPSDAMQSSAAVWTWDKPGKTNDIYIIYPKGKQITNLTSNPNTIPDVNLYEKIKNLGSKSEIQVNGQAYTLEICHSGAYFNYPLKITIG